MLASVDLSIIPHPIWSADQASGRHIGGSRASSPAVKLFVPTLSLRQCPSKRLGKILGWAPKPCWHKKNSLRLSQTTLAWTCRRQFLPHHAILDTGVLEVLLPPRAFPELGFRLAPPTTALIRVSTLLLFPGIWLQTSARAQSPFPRNHNNM